MKITKQTESNAFADKTKTMNKIQTLGDLKKSGYQSKSIKDELRSNLIRAIENGEQPFEGIHG